MIACVACSPKTLPLIPDSTASDNPEVEKEFRKARELYENDKDKEADGAFARLVADHPTDPLARMAAIYRALIALSRDDPSHARKLLESIVGDDDPVAERAAFYDGVALHRLGQHKAAIDRLTPFIGRLTDPRENLLLLDTLWKAAKSSGNTKTAVIWIDSYLAHAPQAEDRVAAFISLEKLINEMDNIGELEDLGKSLHPDESAWPMVMARLTKLHFDSGRLEKASKVLEKIDAQKRGDEPAVKDIASSFEQRTSLDLNAVGCIVPLSGRSRLVGEAVLKGVMLGAKAIPLGDNGGLSVTIRDSGGDPKRAAEAVDELVLAEHVTAIVGPLDGNAALAAAERAEELEVPMLTLSIREDLPEGRRFVFREFATNRSEVKALVDAARRAGHRRFAVFYPDNGYGRTMRGLMADELSSLGLILADEVKYAPRDTAFVDKANELAAAEFDALFIPTSAAHIALLAPALAAAGLWSTGEGEEPAGPGRAVQLLVPSIGRAPDLIRRAGRYLEGALFTSFLEGEASLGGAGFVEEFYVEYKTKPSYLAGFGHDAVVLVAGAIRSGARNREGIRRWLSESDKVDPNTLPLATPFTGFSDSGGPRALPWVVQLTENQFKVLR
ncbi:MAG: ABC transporter substrate-binding protein [Proteobacteria bacterium]|nr:ABC transporter substrate-binding protein [Pseudomonadota bacterium]